MEAVARIASAMEKSEGLVQNALRTAFAALAQEHEHACQEVQRLCGSRMEAKKQGDDLSGLVKKRDTQLANNRRKLADMQERAGGLAREREEQAALVSSLEQQLKDARAETRDALGGAREVEARLKTTCDVLEATQKECSQLRCRAREANERATTSDGQLAEARASLHGAHEAYAKLEHEFADFRKVARVVALENDNNKLRHENAAFRTALANVGGDTLSRALANANASSSENGSARSFPSRNKKVSPSPSPSPSCGPPRTE